MSMISFEGGFVSILMIILCDDMDIVCPRVHKPGSINLTETNFGPPLIVDTHSIPSVHLTMSVIQWPHYHRYSADDNLLNRPSLTPYSAGCRVADRDILQARADVYGAPVKGRVFTGSPSNRLI
jgi:hypothetical protein